MRTRSEHLIGAYTPSENSVLIMPVEWIPPEERRAIICLHGHGGSAYNQFVPGLLGPGDKAQALADAGFYVLSIDAGGGTTWNNNTAMTAISGAYYYLMGLGMSTERIGLMAWSMGGGNALQWMKENPTKVAACLCFAPNTDLSYFYAGGSGSYSAEILAAYGGNYANSVGHRIADEYPTWRDKAPIKIVHGDADPTAPISKSQSFVSGVNQPQVTLATMIGGDHFWAITMYPHQDAIDFFNAGDWVPNEDVVLENPVLILSPESVKYQDSARTTPVTADGQPVGSWSDLVASGHASQATAGKRFVHKVGVLNGYDVVESDGVDDYLEGPISDIDTSTWFIVARKMTAVGAASATCFGLKKDSSNRATLFANTTEDDYGFFATEAIGTAQVGGVATDWNIIILSIISPSLMEIRLNGGGPQASFDPHLAAVDAVSFMLGANNQVAGTFGDFQYGEIRRYDFDLTTVQKDYVVEQLATKFALPWNPAI